MHTLLKSVLTVNEIDSVNRLVASEPLVDGRITSVLAGKRNLQLPLDSSSSQKAGAIVAGKLVVHEDFEAAVLPVAIHPPLFSRYEVGMEYPNHVDAALMGGIRTDVAVTVFLSDLDTYEGGELVVDIGNHGGIRSYRLQAGDAIAYPANTVHHVARVRRGVRLVAALWVQSSVRDPLRRQIIYELGRCTKSLDGTACGGRVRKAYWNLFRMWAETSPNCHENSAKYSDSGR